MRDFNIKKIGPANPGFVCDYCQDPNSRVAPETLSYEDPTDCGKTCEITCCMDCVEVLVESLEFAADSMEDF